jgi:hypothetical protein
MRNSLRKCWENPRRSKEGVIYRIDALWVKKILLPKGHLFKVLEPHHTLPSPLMGEGGGEGENIFILTLHPLPPGEGK